MDNLFADFRYGQLTILLAERGIVDTFLVFLLVLITQHTWLLPELRQPMYDASSQRPGRGRAMEDGHDRWLGFRFLLKKIPAKDSHDGLEDIESELRVFWGER